MFRSKEAWAIFLIGLIFFVKKLEKITLLVLSLVFFISFILAFYHFGIEQGFFQETTACFTDNLQNELTKEQILEKRPGIKPTSSRITL